ncbi:glycoside hydrolase family 57 protein [Myxococcota bacterium]
MLDLRRPVPERARAELEASVPSRTCGYLALVLHAHLPYVRHPEYERFLEERWLFEAVTETYIPLIKFLDRLRDEGVRFRLTVSLSPTLATMLEDELLRERYQRHLELCVRLADAEIGRTRDWPGVHRLACMYRVLFEEAREVFLHRCGTRVVTALRDHQETGGLELITCAGTHGFLPGLAADPASVRAQILAGVREHQRLFGCKPPGLWLPECGYYPGLDQVLVEAGLRYTILETHGIEHATPRPLMGVHAPVICPSGLAAFGRNPSTSRLVWSGNVGYPADANYREYHRDIGFDLDQGYLEPYQYAAGVRASTGIKYHRITSRGPRKDLYDPDRGCEVAVQHAQDFVGRCLGEVRRVRARTASPAIVLSPYDAELFGHWWFEGPQWLYHVLRGAAGSAEGLGLVTPSEYLDLFPVHQRGTPAPTSWGHRGYSEHWVNPKTQWVWRPLHEAGLRWRAILAHRGLRPPGEARALRQAGRELLLAQSSDWPFAITNGTTEQYATRRFWDHLSRCHELLSDLEGGTVNEEKLGALEHMDAIFPELDVGWWSSD